MNIEYSKKKHDLRQDPLVDSLIEAKTYVTKNSRLLTIGIVALLVVAASVLGFFQMRAASAGKADEAFGKALSTYAGGDAQKAITELGDVANEYKGTPQAAYSAYVLGTVLVAEERLDEAIEWFGVAAKGGRASGFVPAAALEGLSVAYEAKKDYDKAIELGTKALGDNRIVYRHAHLRWRLALLSKTRKDAATAQRLCQELVSDTSASSYHQRARNLIAELRVESKS